MELSPLIILAISIFATIVGTPIARRIALRYKIVDAPIEGSSKTHSEPTPYLGGLGLFIAIIACTWIILNNPETTLLESVNPWLVLGSITLIFLVGLWDDLWGMIPGVKMLMLAVAPP